MSLRSAVRSLLPLTSFAGSSQLYRYLWTISGRSCLFQSLFHLYSDVLVISNEWPLPLCQSSLSLSCDLSLSDIFDFLNFILIIVSIVTLGRYSFSGPDGLGERGLTVLVFVGSWEQYAWPCKFFEAIWSDISITQFSVHISVEWIQFTS